MSFSHTIKTELCEISAQDTANRFACLYGMLLFLRRFDRDVISLQIEHEGVATLFSELICEQIDSAIQIKQSSAASRGGVVSFTLSIENERDRLRIVERFMPLGTINHSLISGDDSCMSAFLRGVFLVAGSCTDPIKGYHFELNSPSESICNELASLITEQGMAIKRSKRKGNSLLYLKESEHIEDILTYMGAMKSSLELMNVKIYKDVRNKVNRTTNCETANISRTLEASMRQIADIEYIISAGRQEDMSEGLQELAQLRAENPDLSLRELGMMLNEPISRSGVNHRLERISAFAQELRDERT